MAHSTSAIWSYRSETFLDANLSHIEPVEFREKWARVGFIRTCPQVFHRDGFDGDLTLASEALKILLRTIPHAFSKAVFLLERRT